MRRLLLVLCLALACALPVTAEQFRLMETRSETVLGPFEYKDGERIPILDYTFEIQKEEPEPEDDGSAAVERRMQQIILPSIEFRRLCIPAAFTKIAELAAESDPEGKGVNIVVRLPPEEEGKDDETDSKEDASDITLNLRQISVLEAIRITTEVTDYRYRITPEGVVIFPRGWPDGPLETRTYPILPSIIDVTVEHYDSAEAARDSEPEQDLKEVRDADIQEFFYRAGVPFPRGATITFIEATSTLVARNTAENLDILERILAQVCVVPIQVEIEAKLVEIRDPPLLRELKKGYTRFQEAGWLLADQLKVIAQNRLLTKTGLNAMSSNLTRRHVSPPEGADKTEEIEIGDVLNVTPTVACDGCTIDLTFVWSFREFAGWAPTPPGKAEEPIALIAEKQIVTSCILYDGEHMILNVDDGGPRLDRPAGAPSRRILVLSARLLNPEGKPLHD